MPGYPDCTSWKDRRCQDTPIASAGRLEKQWLRCKTEVDAAKVACTEEALNFTSYLTLTSPYLDLYIDNDLTSPFFLPYLYLSIPSDVVTFSLALACSCSCSCRCSCICSCRGSCRCSCSWSCSCPCTCSCSCSCSGTLPLPKFTFTWYFTLTSTYLLPYLCLILPLHLYPYLDIELHFLLT